jgi:hypothetical protein
MKVLALPKADAKADAFIEQYFLLKGKFWANVVIGYEVHL